MGARKLKKIEQLSPDARYELLIRLASGGMGAVFVGHLRAQPGALFAIKRAHAHLVEEPEFRKMFVAEARLASRIQHPNAIGVIDVDESDGELLMVMRYVEGGSLSDMLVASSGRGRRIPPPVTMRILVDAARGLDAAHELRDERGQPLGIVHRDVSPHNILVGLDGVGAIVDFGVAKAASIESTRTATDILKGKTAYMAPEYVKSRVANAQTDVFSLATVAWEALANRRLFKGEDEMDTMRRVLSPEPPPPLGQVVSIDPTVGAVIARGLARDPVKRFPTARSFADALENASRSAELLASPAEVSTAVKELLAQELQERRTLLLAALAETSIPPASIAAGAPPVSIADPVTVTAAAASQSLGVATRVQERAPPLAPQTVTAAAVTTRAHPPVAAPTMTVPAATVRRGPPVVSSTALMPRSAPVSEVGGAVFTDEAPVATVTLDVPLAIAPPLAPPGLPTPIAATGRPASPPRRAAPWSVGVAVVLGVAALIGLAFVGRSLVSGDAGRPAPPEPASEPLAAPPPGPPSPAPTSATEVSPAPAEGSAVASPTPTLPPTSTVETAGTAGPPPSSPTASASASPSSASVPPPAPSPPRPSGRPPGWRPKANPYGN